MEQTMVSWLGRAEQGDFSFLEDRGFDRLLLEQSINDSSRVLADGGTLDNFGRAVICLAMDDPGIDERLQEISYYPYPTVFALLLQLQAAGRLGTTGELIVETAQMLAPIDHSQEWNDVLPIYQMGKFATQMCQGQDLKAFRPFFFQPLPNGCTDRLAKYIIGVSNDQAVEQALKDSYLHDFFMDKELGVLAAKWLLGHETDREALFLTVRHVWQSISQPRNTFLSKYKSSFATLSPRVNYDDLAFNPNYRFAVLPQGLGSARNVDKLKAWCPQLRDAELGDIIGSWGRLMRPPYRKDLEEGFIQQVTDYLSHEGHSCWCIALLCLLGIIRTS